MHCQQHISLTLCQKVFLERLDLNQNVQEFRVPLTLVRREMQTMTYPRTSLSIKLKQVSWHLEYKRNKQKKTDYIYILP